MAQKRSSAPPLASCVPRTSVKEGAEFVEKLNQIAVADWSYAVLIYLTSRLGGVFDASL